MNVARTNVFHMLALTAEGEGEGGRQSLENWCECYEAEKGIQG